MTGFHFRAESQDDEGAIAVSGAGESGYLGYIHQEIVGAFCDQPDETLRQFDKRLRRIVREFYKDHVIVFSPYPEHQPGVELIVGAQRRGERRLWVTSGNTARLCEHAAVGTGASYAGSVLRKLFEERDTVSATNIAALAVFAAKERDEKCGKNTVVISITNNFFGGVGREQIEEWEKGFKNLGTLDADILRYCLGFAPRDDAPAKEILDHITSSMESLRALLTSD